jgi:transposase InsO family protein
MRLRGKNWIEGLMMDQALRRRRWIIRRRLEGWKVNDIADALRISEKTVDRWWRLYRKEGWEGLAVKSRVPHRFYRTPQETLDYVLKLRREKNWGPCKIEGFLRNYGVEGVKPVSHGTIHAILVKAGLNNAVGKPRKVWGKRRFERTRSNSLWQADFKMTDMDEWMISFLDDHSRFVPGSIVHNDPTAENAIQLLKSCISRYGKPEQILTDRGTQFYPARGGVSAFTQFCSGNGIEHIVASVRRPSTIGKIEAFHKAYVKEAWMFPSHKGFVDYWNYERPHQGIRYLYPADIYFKDLNKGTDVSR